MDGKASVRETALQHQHPMPDVTSDAEYGRGSFLGHGFRVTRSASPSEARIEVYSKDRWWLMCRVCRLSSAFPDFLWQREWMRVGQAWRTGVEDVASEILGARRG